MLTNANKRPALCDLTHVEVDDCIENAKCFKLANSDTLSFMPKPKETGEKSSVSVADVEDMNSKKAVYTKNIHPSLAMYHCDVNASSNSTY